MKTTFARLAPLSFALAFAASAPINAHAQTRSNTPASVDARAQYLAGVQALEQGRYADAMVAFEASYQARPVPIVLYNLALTYRGLGRTRAAIDAFERYLARPEANAPRDRIEAVNTELPRLRASLARIVVIAPGITDRVMLDDQDAVTLGQEISVDPGRHRLETHAADGSVIRRDVTLAAGASERIELVDARPVSAQVPTAVAVTTTQSTGAARVRFDGETHPVQPARRGWVVPVILIGAGVLVAGAAITTGVVLGSTPQAPYMASWGVVREH